MEVFVVFIARFLIVEFFARLSIVRRNFPRLVRGGDAMTRSVWLAYVVLAAMVAAAIAAVVAVSLSASGIVAIPWSAGSFVVTFGLGITAYDFLNKP